jgi:DNA-directed RNA polymerase specialized sigma24 family protein
MSDSELLGRLLAGEQKAYRELVARYQGAMRAVAYALVGSRYADEVVQDARFVVARSLAGFQERASLKTWLLTITANTAKTRLKHSRREVLLDDLPAPHGTVGDERFFRRRTCAELGSKTSEGTAVTARPSPGISCPGQGWGLKLMTLGFSPSQ